MLKREEAWRQIHAMAMENPVKNELTDYDSKFVAINRVRIVQFITIFDVIVYDSYMRRHLNYILAWCGYARFIAWRPRWGRKLNFSLFIYSPPFCVITWLWVTPPRAPKPPPQHHYTSRGTSMRRCTISHNESYKKMSHQKPFDPVFILCRIFYAKCPHKGQKVIFDLFFDENLIEISKIWTKVIV